MFLSTFFESSLNFLFNYLKKNLQNQVKSWRRVVWKYEYTVRKTVWMDI